MVLLLRASTTMNNFKSCTQSNKTRLRFCGLKMYMRGSFSQQICASDVNAMLVVMGPKFAEICYNLEIPAASMELQHEEAVCLHGWI